MAPVRILTLLDVISPYGHGILRGIYRYARDNSVIEVIRRDLDPRSDDELYRRSSEFDGVIVQISMPQVQSFVTKLGIPVVNVSNVYSDLPFPTVISDNYEVGRAAARHFWDLGHRRLAYFGIPSHVYSESRKKGFVDAAKQLGAQLYSQPVESDFPTSLRRFIKSLASKEKPIAVFTCNDHCARRIAMVCAEQNLPVPEDIAILGCDNDELLCEAANPLISSIALGTEAVGQLATGILLSMLKGEKVPPLSLVRHRGIMMRQSSGSTVGDDPQIRQAVTWIRAQVHKGIHVSDVLAHAAMSRRSFELRFKQAMGITPAELIRQEQMVIAKGLLADSEVPVKEIAFRCGFADAKQFSKAFKRDVNLTPSEYRSKHK